MPSLPQAVVLLGAQRFEPSLGECVAELGVRGRMALITAGWQEREGEDEELSTHLGGDTVNLRLHARGDAIFREDPEFVAAHRQRQDLFRHLQELYRIRLEKALEAEEAVLSSAAPERMRDEVRGAAVEAIRDLDEWHLEQCAAIRAEFDERWDTHARPSVARHREELARLVEGSAAIAIAGGHVAILVNRLHLFGIGPLMAGRCVFAWSAGAMALSERLVLFHDEPPQGHGATEMLDRGLGLVPDVVVLPEPERRLHLGHSERVASLARRFAPAVCLALPARSAVLYRHDRFEPIPRGGQGGRRPVAPIELRIDGTHAEFHPRAHAAHGGRS